MTAQSPGDPAGAIEGDDSRATPTTPERPDSADRPPSSAPGSHESRPSSGAASEPDRAGVDAPGAPPLPPPASERLVRRTVPREAWRRSLLLGCVALVVYAFPSGRSLWNPDEPREAEIGREMAVTGDLVVPHLNGQAFLEKPPLYAWMEDSVFALTKGPSPWGARLPSGLCGAATVALTALAGEVWLGSGAVAGAILATCPLFFWHSTRANLDVPLTLFVLLSLMALELGYPVRAALAAALAFLDKGLVGPALVGMIWIGRAAWERDTERLTRLPWLRMVAAFCVPVVPWLAAFGLREHGAYLYAFIYTHHVYRYTHGFDHLQPWYHYLWTLPAGTFPWALGLFPFVWRFWSVNAARADAVGGEAQAVDARLRLLVCWLAIPFLFFTLSASKRDLYLLPTYPALALAVAWALAGRPTLVRRGAWTLGVLALALQVIGFRWYDPLMSIDPLVAQARELSLPLYGYALGESELGILTFPLGHPIPVVTSPGELPGGKIAVLVDDQKSGPLRDAMPMRERKRQPVGQRTYLLLIRDPTPPVPETPAPESPAPEARSP